MTNAKGKVVQTYDYDSFGNLKNQKNRIKQPYTFTGREYDRETGLYYYRARYYDPVIGRFISKDPIGFEGGINLYKYADNNPVNAVDPYGEFPAYGYWCGPDWTGGYSKPWNELSSGQKRSANKPVDALDNCCMRHDKCYGKCRDDYPCDEEKRCQCLKKCDRALSSCSSGCNSDGVMDLAIQTYFYWSQPCLF